MNSPFWRERVLPALLQGAIVGGGMALVALLYHYNAWLFGGLAGIGTAAIIMLFPKG